MTLSEFKEKIEDFEFRLKIQLPYSAEDRVVWAQAIRDSEAEAVRASVMVEGAPEEELEETYDYFSYLYTLYGHTLEVVKELLVEAGLEEEEY